MFSRLVPRRDRRRYDRSGLRRWFVTGQTCSSSAAFWEVARTDSGRVADKQEVGLFAVKLTYNAQTGSYCCKQAISHVIRNCGGGATYRLPALSHMSRFTSLLRLVRMMGRSHATHSPVANRTERPPGTVVTRCMPVPMPEMTAVNSARSGFRNLHFGNRISLHPAVMKM